jgi:hypothetical protein
MSTAGRPASDAPAPSAIAERLDEATFVRLVATATGDALAATGVVARALRASEIPFQATVAPAFESPDRTTEADVTVGVGWDGPGADLVVPATATPASEQAHAVAAELGSAPVPVLALAGVLASEHSAGNGPVVETATDAGVSQRPGVGVPTADLETGLAHTTFVHAPFSGDEDAVAAALADLDLPDELDESDHRRVASMVTLSTLSTDDASDRASTALARVLRPHVAPDDCSFQTVEGYGDVLDVLARTTPGTGVALALGHDVRDEALSVWRDHTATAHDALATAATQRYDGCFVARDDEDRDAGVLETAVRLLADFRSPEPVTLFVSDEYAVARASEGYESPLGDAMASAASNVEGEAARTPGGARARFDVDASTFVGAFREAL